MRTDGTKIGGRAVGEVLNNNKANWREAWALFPGNVAYVWQGYSSLPTWNGSYPIMSSRTRNLIVWAKSQFAIGRGNSHPQHELAGMPFGKAERATTDGGRKQSRFGR